MFGLATGYGLDDDVLGAYHFLSQNYRVNDTIFLFGFSPGAYTVRMLAGLLHLVGLLRPDQLNVDGYLLSAYKRCSEEEDMSIAWNFRRVIATQTVKIRFLGAWDTVASVFVPHKFYVSTQVLPYTRTNPAVAVFRHAIAIDERRRMFRLNRWSEPQEFRPNPFLKVGSPLQQDIKQVWFAGVHADIGGGYAEIESGLSKYPLHWMIEEAKAHGLIVNTAMQNHLVLGYPRKGSNQGYVAPDPEAMMHKSLTRGWQLLEWLPKSIKWKEWPSALSLGRFYLPLGEPRVIPDNARIHYSVFERIRRTTQYRPSNLPNTYLIEGP